MGKVHETANRNLDKVIALCSEMLELADLGDHYRPDDGCGVVFGSLRDSAYKIRSMAKDELARHERNRSRSRSRNGNGNGSRNDTPT